jgi:hypothetical protein
MRHAALLFIGGALAQLAAAEAVSPTTKVGVAFIADQTVLAQAEHLPDAAWAVARGLRMCIAIPGRDRALVNGLNEWAKRHPEQALKVLDDPTPKSIRDGYLGFKEVGRSIRVDARIEGAQAWLASPRMAETPALFAVFTHADDLPSGRVIEVPVDTRPEQAGGLSINVSNSRVGGMGSQRVAGGGTLQLPNVASSQVHASGMGLDTGDALPSAAAPAEPLHAARDPRVAWEDYRSGMEAIERAHPGMRVIWTTMPLLAKGNSQRTWFNVQLRTYAQAHGKLLFDIAALAAHDRQGALTATTDGEEIAKDWQEAERPSQLNAEGRQRLALAWVWLVARASGWQPAAAVPATAGAPGAKP